MSTGSSSTTGDSIWNNWTTSNASTTAYDSVWQTWTNTGTSSSAGSYRLVTRAAANPIPTTMPGALEATAEAKNKAEALLQSLLTPEQRKQLEQQSAFIVKSELGKMYRIRRGSSQNIDELDTEGKPTHRLCIQCVDNLPVADLMAIQKLMLEMDERRLLSIAVRTPIRN